MQSTSYIVTSCHGNNDEMWSTSCLIMHHKPYIVEQLPPLHYHYTKVCKYAMSSFSVVGHSLVIYRWHNYFNNIMFISQCKCNGKYSRYM